MPVSAERIVTTHPLVDGCAPEWASGWGHDAQGPFVEFSVGEVRQRLRWIPPGRFLMGSPYVEPGREHDEGPQHWVEISHGFWLFDTPCTQNLWQAVMDGDNPSRFQSADRPVEHVNWEDTQRFIQRVPTLILGLKLSLPTESEWEYACRAGTTRATYGGSIEILGEDNVPLLNAIAWYRGNSGVDFELKSGVDTTDWTAKQSEFEQAGTHPVGMKAPNAWGLYDMLGNVWEWCRDGRRHYSERSELNPVVEEIASALVVVRGGSWRNDARYVRAACRIWHSPGSRYNYLGFRCRVQ